MTTPDGQAYHESDTVKPGDAVVTYDCDGVTVGCSICYDLRFPELFQALAEKGAQMIALPAAFTHADRQGPLGGAACAPAPSRRKSYVCASGQTGAYTVQQRDSAHTYGHSLVADPWGLVVAKASEGVGIVSARIDPARVKATRAMIPVAEHKRRLSQR